jgi:hypothetical protein
MSQFAIAYLKEETPVDDPKESKVQSLWRRIRQFVGKHQIALGAGFACFGWAIFGLFSSYTMRSVHSIILRRGGKNVTIRTLRTLPSDRYLRSINVPLQDLTARQSRTQPGATISLQLRGGMFYFIIDKSGEFLHPTLFDNTIGVWRNLKATKK